MNHKNYFVTVGCITAVVALLQLLRVISDISIIVGGWAVPLWLSWLPVIVVGGISYTSFRRASGK